MAPSNVVVSPGTEGGVNVVVRNLGDVTETYALVPTGISQGWTTVTPSTISLYPGAEEVVHVTLRPAKSFAIPAGRTPLIIRIVPHGNPDDVATAEGTLTVLEYDDRRIGLAQPVMRSRRRQEFDVVFDNHGNSRTSCRLSILDHTSRVVGRFDPPSLGVDPGMNETVRLRLKARRRRWRRGRTLPFTVVAAQDGHESAQTSGTLLQEPTISGRFIGRVLTLGAAAGLGAVGWFHLVHPAIDKAAERAVQRIQPVAVSEVSVATTAAILVTPPGQTGASVPETIPSVTTPAAKSGSDTPFDTRLVVEAPLAQQNVKSYLVPVGKTLDVSDVFIQNPNGDIGRIVLLRNADKLYEWNLENVRDTPLQYVSPLQFTEGETVSLQLTCSGPGDSSTNLCSVAASLSGSLRQA